MSSGTATIYQMTASSAQGQNPVKPVLVGQIALASQRGAVATQFVVLAPGSA